MLVHRHASNLGSMSLKLALEYIVVTAYDAPNIMPSMLVF